MDYRYAVKGLDKERTAKAVGKSLSISYKHSKEVCDFIRGKKAVTAVKMLNDVMALKRAVPYKRFKRDLAHKTKIGPGRYPVKTARNVLEVLESAISNAEYKGLNTDELIVSHICSHKASTPYRYGRHRGRKMKRSHVEIVLEQPEGTKPKKKQSTKKQKTQKKQDKKTQKKSKSSKKQEKKEEKKQDKKDKSEKTEDKEKSKKETTKKAKKPVEKEKKTKEKPKKKTSKEKTKSEKPKSKKKTKSGKKKEETKEEKTETKKQAKSSKTKSKKSKSTDSKKKGKKTTTKKKSKKTKKSKGAK